MLRFREIRTCLGRVTAGRRPISPVQARGFSSASTVGKATRYFVITSVAVGTPYLWWLLAPSTRDQVPFLERPPTEMLTIEPGPSNDEVTGILAREAYSFQVRSVAGVRRYDGSQLAANSPCEDRFTHGKFPSPWKDGNHWMAWGIFDGHSGWQTSDLLTQQLLPFVRHSLSQVSATASKDGTVPDETVQHAIKKAFVDLDDSIIKTGAGASQSEEPLRDKLKKLAVSYAGSCALLSIYDPVTSKLHVACTGDSRAVLGQKSSNGQWEAIPLSVDQTGDNQDEIARLSREHPGEENIVKDGRVLGMMVSRAFGDARWKWPLELQQSFVRRFYGIPPLAPTYDFRTPPYLTAEPVVTTTKIDPNKPSFLILASDGLWYTISNQQAVDLVGKWVESPAVKKGNDIPPSPTHTPFDFGHFWQGVSWKFKENRTTIQDDNAAVHLMRNALGGNHHELLAGRVTFNPPSARRVRDDITVQVVLFNSQP
ncbi:putative pyruvate dehydrogenase [Xylaria telfairii]|nr:putative pyruvate dehydrogenase [Xylaria telfairii]